MTEEYYYECPDCGHIAVGKTEKEVDKNSEHRCE